MSIWTLDFWKATTERALSTAAQSAILTLGADQFNVITVDWLDVGGFALGGAALSILKALGASRIGDGSPSLARRAEGKGGV